jgi:hypothetical protein
LSFDIKNKTISTRDNLSDNYGETALNHTCSTHPSTRVWVSVSLKPLSCIVLLSLLLTGCRLLNTPTPPPGWRDPVYRLLLQEDSFPSGWKAGYVISERIKDPTTNHVTMEWLYADGGLVYQSIWRAYTIEDAETKYKQVKQEWFEPNQTLVPDINSTKADKFYIACGGTGTPRCVAIAQYRNYIVALAADLSGTIGDYTQDEGLTYPEIEALIRDMDKIFETIQK